MQGTGPLGVEHQSDPSYRHFLMAHNGAMSFGWVLAQVARRRERISVLDFGGGCGHFFHFARALAPDVTLDYCVRDTPTLAALGAELCPQATFYTDDVCFDRRYDLVWAQCALHYVRDWPAMVHRMAAAADDAVYLALVPTTLRAPSYVYLQRAQKSGYQTEYLSWCIRRAELVREAKSAGLQLTREFVYGPAPHVVGAPEPFRYMGGYFKVKQA
jgi:putative methyltransferase (TIGR04325 family)